MNLKCTLLSKRGQSENATYYMIPFVRYSGKDTTKETKKRPVVSRHFFVGGEVVEQMKYRGFFRIVKLSL